MKIFSLYECCIPVKGAKVSIICDLQRGNYMYISQGLYEILTVHKNEEIDTIKSNYETSIHDTIDEYFEYLIENEWGFWNDEVEAFPPLDLTFEQPETINNAIIDSNFSSNHNFEKIFLELDYLGCKFLELRFFDSISSDDLDNILSYTNGYQFRNISIYIKYDENEIIDDLIRLVRKYPSIGYLFVHSSPERKTYSEKILRNLIYLKDNITESSCCGNIGLPTFAINTDFFLESQKYNNCLNKKISIDVDGYIKNCPSMTKNYGISDSNSLIETAFKKKFQSFWHIRKDQIMICKDCQFRYICSDCRAYLDNVYEKPVKCKYDPYEHKWLD